ncbi:MAG: radical SAM protein, partial [Clostridia bacterium]|nr:radical SAM protein [Clostridia bacterium]
VPVTDETLALAPGDEEREMLTRAVEALRAQFDEAIFLQFPGDEKASDGCLAAGRGFFHINSHGGAEPCPFSPYSDVSVKDRPLADALSSPLFTKLRDGGLLEGEHEGGCTLFARRADVAAILQ